MSLPSKEEFYRTQLSHEEMLKLIELQKYKDFIPMHFETVAKYQDKVAKYRKQLAIITEQEKPQSTEQEEKAMNYWAQQLSDFRMKGDGEAYLLNLKEQIEAKYRAAMADVEAKIELCRANRQQKESYFSGRLQTAQQQLETIKTFKSKPRIRAEMELADAEAPLNYDQEGMAKKKDYDALMKDISARETAWRAARWQEISAKAEVPVKQAATAPKVKRQAKRVEKTEARDYPLEPLNVTMIHYQTSNYDHLTHQTQTQSVSFIPWTSTSGMF